MLSISGEKSGFSLVEALVAIIIVSITVLIALTPSRLVNNALHVFESYFSQDRPLDSKIHAYQLILAVGEALSKKGFGTSVPDISGILDSTDVKISVEPVVEIVSYSGRDILEVLTIVATYTSVFGEEKTVVKKFVRGNF